ncbi:beta-lactamase class D [Chitinophaga skermanii]|uniref:beta-lactamase n=1 Tax=Chitinophaga skermanii TaxID=331697 RepID=A0A327Q0Z7_9BACT|nr:penicillin-binding transpeptidase domain-containing protein [Chitinophaga skermanii]RAI97564.1 beta-lactamase class D [Chitinophaga skermanii]
MKPFFFSICLLTTLAAHAQSFQVKDLLAAAHVEGSVTIYNVQNNTWYMSDSLDAIRTTQPASTFKIINLLIALETGVINNLDDVMPWVGSTDTVKYGYRPDIYKNMTIREAFQVSAGWVFIELAKKVGRKKYIHYLQAAGYGNNNLTEQGDDFWNFGAFGISPKNQVEFITKVYREQALPFQKKYITLLKEVMISEQNEQFTTRSKTGWTRVDGQNIGWWVGYITSGQQTYCFATRVTRPLAQGSAGFSNCRKSITMEACKRLGFLR